jgi:hypothetical protein
MPHPQSPVVLAKVQSLQTQLQSCQNWQSFSANLNSAFSASGSLSTNTYGSSDHAAGPGGSAYAVYAPMPDGSMHLSAALTLSGTGGEGWFAMTSSNLPFSPVTNKYFPAFTDELASPSSNAAGCGVCMDSSGGLHAMGMSSSAVILVFDVCVPMAW